MYVISNGENVHFNGKRVCNKSMSKKNVIFSDIIYVVLLMSIQKCLNMFLFIFDLHDITTFTCTIPLKYLFCLARLIPVWYISIRLRCGMVLAGMLSEVQY